MTRSARDVGYRLAQEVHHGLMARSPATYAAANLGIQLAEGWVRSRLHPWNGVEGDLRRAFRRTGSTLYILGSGTSINEITDEQWLEVGRQDSIGLNFWLLHQFVPSAYSQELTTGATDLDRERAAIRHRIVAARAGELAATPFLFRVPARRRRTRQQGGGALTPAQIHEQLPLPPGQVHLTSDLALLPVDVAAFSRLVAAGRPALAARPQRPLRHLPYARSTTIWSLFLALRMGYEQVVLCGVDLNDTAYFYESPDAPHLVPDLPIPPSAQTGTVHATNDPARRGATAAELIVAIDQHLFRARGSVLSVASPGSALAGPLPLHRWPAGR